MPVNKLKSYLDQNGVRYVSIRHSNAFTAQEIASSAHVSGNEFAKTVMIRIDGRMAMAVLPAAFQVDFERLRQAFGTKKVSLASEAEFMSFFPDCEIGAMPPFGNLYDMEVYVAEKLSHNREIAFNAGTHTEIIKLSYPDFERLVKPNVFPFAWKTVAMPHDPGERWAEDY